VGHNWVRNDAGDWFCLNCHVITASSILTPSVDQKFTPATSGIVLRVDGKSVFEAYDCEEMQLYKIHAS
jgi:hypothetical protein